MRRTPSVKSLSSFCSGRRANVSSLASQAVTGQLPPSRLRHDASTAHRLQLTPEWRTSNCLGNCQRWRLAKQTNTSHRKKRTSCDAAAFTMNWTKAREVRVESGRQLRHTPRGERRDLKRCDEEVLAFRGASNARLCGDGKPPN